MTERRAEDEPRRARGGGHKGSPRRPPSRCAPRLVATASPPLTPPPASSPPPRRRNPRLAHKAPTSPTPTRLRLVTTHLNIGATGVPSASNKCSFGPNVTSLKILQLMNSSVYYSYNSV
ncbi:hypothetical protein DFH09DRAFT_1302088 [Mycena vulgaris]|nr:hypothetical protein DFH09DRAFT_1302088 [Mycena vulgaris]